jgi:cytochrome b561
VVRIRAFRLLKGFAMQPARYHPALVALHWILAVMILVSLLGGLTALSDLPNDDPTKVLALRSHMIFGLAILVLMLVRLVTRLRTAKPEEADIGNTVLNRLQRPGHWAIYAAVFGMVASGIALSAAAGLPPIVFEGTGDPLPESFQIYTARIVHGVFAWILLALIVGHIAAAGWHQGVRGDGLLRRMWFGRR